MAVVGCISKEEHPCSSLLNLRQTLKFRSLAVLLSLVANITVTALCHTLTDTPDAPPNEAAKRKVNKYRNSYANNHSISFLPAITSTSARMHGEFLRLLFLQAHRASAKCMPFEHGRVLSIGIVTCQHGIMSC